MCAYCQELIRDFKHCWKIYGHYFCCRRCVDDYKKAAYERGQDLD